MTAYSIAAISGKFREIFNADPLIVRSPGRINLIGEHTDYNEGFVLPAAIDQAMYTAIGKRSDRQIHLYANEFKAHFKIHLDELKPVKGWPDYILGVIDQLMSKGYPLKGFNMVIDGNIPIGAGLSSSAALECAVIFALNTLFEFAIDRIQMVKYAQAAEHKFAGVMCGIMDQFASMFGRKNHVIRLDCRSFHYEYFPFNMDGYKIVLMNTNVKHSLASSAYNERRQQCEQGVSWIKEFHPEINSLRDVDPEMLNKYVLKKDNLVYNRCKYVVEENARLFAACNDLKKSDFRSLGQKMFNTHAGLSEQYGVSCRELDLLIDLVQHEDAVIGARMMGGGFGGCTINLVKDGAIDSLIERTAKLYKKISGLEMTAYITQIENGTSLITEKEYASI